MHRKATKLDFYNKYILIIMLIWKNYANGELEKRNKLLQEEKKLNLQIRYYILGTVGKERRNKNKKKMCQA